MPRSRSWLVEWRISHHPHRHHLYVGAPTVKAIWGNRLAPAYADRCLASRGYDSQQTDEPADPERPDNLWSPVPGDAGSHGRFDDRACMTSPYTWGSKHRAALGITAAGIAAMAVWRGRNGQ